MIKTKINKYIFDNYKGIILILISSLLVSLGQLFWKLSLGVNIYLIFIGFMLYGAGAVAMIFAFKYGSLSVLHPMLSMGYVFAILLSKNIMHEYISTTRYLGIILIILGVFFIGGEKN